MQTSYKVLLISAALATFSQTTLANSSTAVALLDDYNLIVSNNATSSSEVDGNALVGGNLSGGNYHIHNTTQAVSSLTVGGNLANATINGTGLNVGGSVTGSVNMNGGGNAYVGSVSGTLQNNANGNGNSYVVGNISGNVNTNGGHTYYGGSLTGNANGSTHQAVSQPFSPAGAAASAAATLTSFAGTLSGLSSNSSYNITGNTAVFNAGTSGLSVFTISNANSFFNSVSQIQFNETNGAKDILINVINSNPSSVLNIGMNFLNSQATSLGVDILWNFENAGSIVVNNQFGGSLLAGNANVTTNQNIEGTLFANNLTQQAEIHSQPLDGGFANITSSNSNSGSVPEPGVLELLALGMLAAWYKSKRTI